MAAIRIYRRLQELQDVDPNGLPQSGVPRYHTDVSSFVVETIAGGAGGSFSLGASTGGNTLGATGVTGTRVVLAGIGNLTLSQSTDANGGTISISGGTAGAGGVAISASDSLFSNGTVVLSGVGGGATVNTAPGTIRISVAAPVAQTVQTQNRFNLTAAGNTAGVLQEVSSGTLTLAGGNNITLSQNGNAITISGAAQSVQPETQTFVGGVAASNTTYTSGTVSIVGSGIVTVQSGTGQRVIINASQSVQAETQTFVGGIIASDTTYTSGSIRFTGVGGGVTVSSNTGQRVDISVAAPVAQTGTQFSGGISTGGNTSGDTGTVGGRLLLAGGNNITVSGSTNGASMTVTISGPNVGGAQTGISGIAASNTTYTSGTVTFSGVGGGITVSSNTGQRVDLSVAAQTVESQSIGMSNLGNTSGTTGIASGGQVRFLFAGGNNITLSQSLNGASGTITISGPNAQTGISGIANSQTTYTSGTVSLSELGAITIRSTTGNQYQFSVNAQTGTQFSAGLTNSGNTSGDTGTVGGRLLLVGTNNITLSGSTNGASMTITMSGPTVGGAQTGISGIANSQTTYTSGTVSMSELGAITIRSTTGNQYQFSVNSQTVQTQGILSAGVSTGGNTSGNTTVNTGSRLVFVGSNNITLSQGTGAGASTITISGPTTAAQTVQTQGILNVALSNIGNTSGDTGINSGTRYVLAGGNGITLSGSSAANATTVTISGITQSVQTQGILSAGVSTGGNTAGNTQVSTGSRLVIVGSNGITASQGTAAGASTITLSGRDPGSAGMSTMGNTSGDTGYATQRLNLAGGNNITLSGSTNGGSMTITISAPNLGAGAFSGGVSTLGNTAGATGISGTQMVLVGSGVMSLSQTTGANGNTVSILAPATSVLSAVAPLSTSTNGSTVSILGPAQLSVGFSTGGNTSGDTGLVTGRVVFAGGSNITLSGSTNAGSMTITISGGAGTGGGGFSAGVSTGGNTAGATGLTGSQMVWVGSSPISLSQTTGANGGTITINAPATSSIVGSSGVSISTTGSTIVVFPSPRTSFTPHDEVLAVTGQQGNATLHIQPVHFPHLQYDRMLLSYQFSNASNSSNSFTISNWIGIYTKNVSTLSLLSSSSTSTNFSGSGTVGSYSLYGGMRHMSMPWTMTLSDGDYWVGIVTRSTTGGGAGHTLNQMLKSHFTSATLTGWSGLMGAATANSVQQVVGLGTYSVSTAGIPSTIGFSEITGTGSLPLFVPLFQFRSGTV